MEKSYVVVGIDVHEKHVGGSATCRANLRTAAIELNGAEIEMPVLLIKAAPVTTATRRACTSLSYHGLTGIAVVITRVLAIVGWMNSNKWAARSSKNMPPFKSGVCAAFFETH